MNKHLGHVKRHLPYFGVLIVLVLMVLPVKTLLFREFTAASPARQAIKTFGMLLNRITPTLALISTPIPTSTPTPTPTPRPFTFAEMNALYGPCAVVPTLFYHHIQDLNTAKQQGHGSLAVDTGTFQKQIQYLKDRGYTPIRPEQLIAFFDSSTPLPAKPILLTFDDGYDDFGTNAAPFLHAIGFSATSFIPTGLIQNPGYMTWQTIADIASWGIIYFANHTWSHHNVSMSLADDQREIGTADKQLADHGLNQAKVFAYPYGFPSANGETVLAQLGYKLGFTTNPGSIQCKGRRLILSRTRIGNANLSAYGL